LAVPEKSAKMHSIAVTIDSSSGFISYLYSLLFVLSLFSIGFLFFFSLLFSV